MERHARPLVASRSVHRAFLSDKAMPNRGQSFSSGVKQHDRQRREKDCDKREANWLGASGICCHGVCVVDAPGPQAEYYPSKQPPAKQNGGK